MKTLGSIRRSDCAEAEIVLVNGVYLTFRLDRARIPLLQNLIEVKRVRLHMRYRESILVDADLLRKARRAAFAAILKHRKAMDIRVLENHSHRAFQLRFSFT